MANHKLDLKGLRCPQPVLKMTALVPKMQPGDMLEVMADCPTFESDVRKWAERLKKPILSLEKGEGSVVTVQVQF